eukprot:TRINITY_DN6024_c2_g1_i1.p1 TRINITY_DN6024_c2_g1~~TRINITY_DN6024_c2_g1_i1.p1  ORF type:complete len:109 (-),score=8.64 TRINITY_DN6024_c2_g1_i1:98-403(-)
MTTVHTILAIAISRSWPPYQMDVKNAFLLVDLKEGYMCLPQGYDSVSKTEVARLCRSLYSLKHALRAWFEKFCSTLLQLGFAQSPYHPSLFTSITSQSTTF